MKDQVRQQLENAIKGIREQGSEPSQLMLDIQTLLNQPEAPQADAQRPASAEGLVDLANPNLEKAVVRLMNCSQIEARRYINVIVRADALVTEAAQQQNG